MVLFSKKDLCTVTSKSTTDLSGIFSSVFYSSCEIALCFFRKITLPQRERGDNRLSLLMLSKPWGLLIFTSLHLSSICLFIHFLQTEVIISLLFIVLPCYLLLPGKLPTGLQSSEGLPGTGGYTANMVHFTPLAS